MSLSAEQRELIEYVIPRQGPVVREALRALLAAYDAQAERIESLEAVRDTLATRLEQAIHELEDLGAGSAPSRYGMVNGSVLRVKP